MDVNAAKMIGAGLAAMGVIGAGIGIGNVWASWISAVARNPAARAGIQTLLVLCLAFIESLAIFTLLIIFVK